MPRGNVELIREAVEALRRRDGAALRELFDEQAEFRAAIVGGGGLYRGHDDIDRYFADFDQAFAHWRTEGERYFDVGGDRVVLLYRVVGRLKEGDVPIDQPIGILFTLRDRRIVLGEAHLDPLEALKEGLKHAFDVFGRGDVVAAAANLDPHIEWLHGPGSGAPEEGLYRGRDEVRSLLMRLRDAWQDMDTEVREVVETGEDKFTVNAVVHAKGKTSGLALDAACEYVLEFRDGKTVRVRFTLTGPATAPSAVTDSAAGKLEQDVR